VFPENFFDSQNGTLTEIFLATGGREVAEKIQPIFSGAKGGQKWPPAVALRHCVCVFYFAPLRLVSSTIVSTYIYVCRQRISCGLLPTRRAAESLSRARGKFF
jgi:hypothetical protein